jgi:hypothetical protein
MSIPLTQVKSLSTASELALVKSSRRPELNKLTAAQLKQRAERARRLFDKWQKQSRSQSRERLSAGKAGDALTRTEAKIQIFRDALDAFEKRLAEVEKTDLLTGAGAKAAGKARPARHGSAVHRAARAESRAELKKVKQVLNTRSAQGGVSRRRSDKPAAAEATAATDTSAGTDRTKQAAKPPVPSKKKGRTGGGPLQTGGLPSWLAPNKQRQLAAKTAARQSRIADSGLKSRVRGHVSARGKRSQARRDSR